MSTLVQTARPRCKHYQTFRYIHDGGLKVVVTRSGRVYNITTRAPKPGLVVERLQRPDDPAEELRRVARFYTRGSFDDARRQWIVAVFEQHGVTLP